MKILLLTSYFFPEIGNAPRLMHELGESLVQRGHEVTVVTYFPRYNLVKMPEKYRGRMCYTETMAGMRVLRINAMNFYGRSILSRGFVQLFVPQMLALRAMLTPKPDLVYALSPPLLMGVIARLIAARFRVPCVLNVQDLFPQTMVDLGVLKNRLLINIFERMERFVYRSATAITVMSDGNRDFVINRGAAPQKVHTVFNWVDTQAIQPGERMNEFRREQGLGDQFLVLFAGAMSVSQGLEVVIDAARELADEPNLLFLLIGEGIARKDLERKAAGLNNVRFLPIQPKDKYPQLLAAADVCLATLRPEVLTPTVPSKIGMIMAAGRPVLASFPLHGDAPRIIAEAGAGIVTPAGDAAALARAVRELKRNPTLVAKLSDNGRRYAECFLSRESLVQKCEVLLREIVEQSK